MTNKNTNDMTEQEFIQWYKETQKDKYEKPSVTADFSIFSLDNMDLNILMIQRGGHPYKDKWALVGGFLDMDENLDTSANRELQEETNLTGIVGEQVYTWSEPNRDPRMRVISTSYMALVDHKELLVAKPQDDANDVKSFSVKIKNDKNGIATLTLTNKELGLELVSKLDVSKFDFNSFTPNVDILESDLAFDHAKVIWYSVMTLRKRTLSSTIVEKVFGLDDVKKLVNAYNIILDDKSMSYLIEQHITKKLVKVKHPTNSIYDLL